MTLRKAIEYKSFGVNFEELDNYALDELKLRWIIAYCNFLDRSECLFQDVRTW